MHRSETDRNAFRLIIETQATMMCQPVEIDFEEAAIFHFSLLEPFSGTFSDFGERNIGQKKRAGQLVASHPAQNGGRRRSRLTLNRTPHSGGSGPTFSPDIG